MMVSPAAPFPIERCLPGETPRAGLVSLGIIPIFYAMFSVRLGSFITSVIIDYILSRGKLRSLQPVFVLPLDCLEILNLPRHGLMPPCGEGGGLQGPP
jgi:hypothetical protein